LEIFSLLEMQSFNPFLWQANVVMKNGDL